ncbi:hypothetical protein RVS70_09415 [Virgibacillus sp. M23]|uniref:hypothetical protein n=1 Tax=Virgibacillus sp. M23 TaxID=3079030 RepID=UPI002A91D3F9|nr:hypothetical protein [Virgibacillus sp. M23]MDY7044422.1 hypothetical protein [Virgibacillus sp. M23]
MKSKTFLKSIGVEPEPDLNPKKMTDEEIARLRFTSVSEEEEKAILKEIRNKK